MNKIAVLISSRKNSKYLAKFLFGLFKNTNDIGQIDVLVMMNAGDTWNQELVEHFELAPYNVRFFTEDYQLGRHGLHVYYNDLIKQTRADWLIYFCDDHFVTEEDWDIYVRACIAGNVRSGDSMAKEYPLNPAEPWVLVPKFDNCGAMNHLVSRGFINALGGVIGNHGWIDSYINDLMRPFPDRVIRMDDVLFHDFTHDVPTPMDEANTVAPISDLAKKLPEYGGGRYERLIVEDRQKIKNVVEG